MSLDDLIADPAGDEEAEDAVFVGELDEDGEDDEVDDAFGVLAVVHGADAGDEAEQGGEAGVGSAGGCQPGAIPAPHCQAVSPGLRVDLGRSGAPCVAPG